MNPVTLGVIFAAMLLVGMVTLMEVGRRLGHRRSKRDEENARAGLGAIETSVFALLGLLIAFTFSGAAGRFDHRRDLIAQETNAIGTAWLRLDTVELSARTSLQELFRIYLDHRLESYRLSHDPMRAWEPNAKSLETQQLIWDGVIAAVAAEPGKPIMQVLLPALNEMFDIAETRTLARSVHPPKIIYLMLGTCALLAALMAGYGMSRGARSWTHIIVFAVVMAGAVYIIIDLEFPRVGLIRVESFDQALVELRRGMDASAPPRQ